jgi:repressor LexA
LFLPRAQIYNGDIVVVLIPERMSDECGATVKRLYREGDRVRLQPENSFMQPIYPITAKYQSSAR